MINATQPATKADLHHIPRPPQQLQRLMLATILMVDGHVEPTPERLHPALDQSFVMPLANVIVVGTRCSRPLLVEEIQNIAGAVDHDAIIVRSSDATKHATYDVLLRGVSDTFFAYRLWIAPLSGSTWLIPSAGETTHIRLGTFGLEAVNHPPFLDEVERHRGLRHARELLSVAVRGWF